MFVSGATALGIAVLVGGGTAGIQTPLAVPAAGVNASAASSVEEGRAEPSPLSVRVMKPARRAPAGDATAVMPLAFADVVDFAPVKPERGPRPGSRPLGPPVAPPVVLAVAPPPVAPVAAPVVAAVPAPVRRVPARVALPPQTATAGPPATAEPTTGSGAQSSADGTDRAQTSKKKAKDTSH